MLEINQNNVRFFVPKKKNEKKKILTPWSWASANGWVPCKFSAELSCPFRNGGNKKMKTVSRIVQDLKNINESKFRKIP